MDKEIYKSNLALVKANEERIKALLKEDTKISHLAAYMLGGRPVTGMLMIRLFNIYSYRDSIYDLTKKGYNINSKVVVAKNGVTHKIWWLSCYDEEFITLREEKVC